MPPPPPGAMKPPPPPPGWKNKNKKKQLHPQAIVSRFWSKYHSKAPGKITSIFPRKLYRLLDSQTDAPSNHVRNAAQSYEAARTQCLQMVRNAVKQCDRTNSRFTDFEFDIETDFQLRDFNCLFGLSKLEDLDSSSEDDAPYRPSSESVRRSIQTIVSSGLLSSSSVFTNLPRLQSYVGDSDDDEAPLTPRRFPQSVHRLGWIFESPQFTVDGFSSSDVMQGAIGDCWWLAAVSNIAHRKDLMDKICVARDEECGVYGFVFHRDGEWIPTIIDDNLYLTHDDFGIQMDIYDSRGKKARLHKKQKQTGSDALFYSKCVDENETWLPLMEKAYAKIHGDYDSINGGWAGSGVEDLTGGVTTLMLANRVLRKDRLWREMLGVDQENGEFVFGLSAASDSASGRKNGLILSHAYSVLKAVEMEDSEGKKLRLLKIRNPWGQKSENGFGEWHGPWSDGSKEWTPYMIQRLRYEFADDGVFWMSFDDVLNNFKWIHRTRLFDARWTIAQQWTSDLVSWVPGYSKKTFVIEVKRVGQAVIVLSNLDTRYFQGLEGQYNFYLEFVLRETGSTEVLAEARGFAHSDRRSVNCEIQLKPGTYEVIPKIVAERNKYAKSIEQVIKTHADQNPRKLRQVGLQYDLAHAKAGVLDEDGEQEKKKRKQRRKQKQPQGKKDKLQEMKDAMNKMQVAMTEMQNELKKEKHQERSESRDEGNVLEEKAVNHQQTGEKEVKEGQATCATGDTPKSPPGLCPGDSMKNEPQSSEATQNEYASPNEKTGEERNNEGNGVQTIDTNIKVESNPANTNQDTGKDAPVPSPPSPNTPTTPTTPATPATPITPIQEPGPYTVVNPPPGNPSASSSESSSDSDSDSDSSDDGVSSTHNPTPPWNPICVMCLRVYAEDKDVTIRPESKSEPVEEVKVAAAPQEMIEAGQGGRL